MDSSQSPFMGSAGPVPLGPVCAKIEPGPVSSRRVVTTRARLRGPKPEVKGRGTCCPARSIKPGLRFWLWRPSIWEDGAPPGR